MTPDALRSARAAQVLALLSEPGVRRLSDIYRALPNVPHVDLFIATADLAKSKRIRVTGAPGADLILSVCGSTPPRIIAALTGDPPNRDGAVRLRLFHELPAGVVRRAWDEYAEELAA